MKVKRVCANFAARSFGVVSLLNPDQKIFLRSLLQRDAVIAYPTEGVWGLGCLPESKEAVMRLLSIKRRSWEKGLLLIAGCIDQFGELLEGLEDHYLSELEANWPGPVTFLVPDNGIAPRWVVGLNNTIGLRVTDHTLARELCDIAGPLVSTSANISESPAAMTEQEVRDYFGDKIDYLVPGVLGQYGRPSEIRMLTTGEVVR